MAIKEKFCWSGEGLGRLEIGTQKGPFSFTMFLDKKYLWLFEMSAPLFGERTAEFDLGQDTLTLKENKFLADLMAGQNFNNKEQQFNLAYAFKKILREIQNPQCGTGSMKCGFENGKIMIQDEEMFVSSQRKIKMEMELIGQSERFFDRIILNLSEGQEDTNFQKIKLVMKIQSCSNVRN